MIFFQTCVMIGTNFIVVLCLCVAMGMNAWILLNLTLKELREGDIKEVYQCA